MKISLVHIGNRTTIYRSPSPWPVYYSHWAIRPHSTRQQNDDGSSLTNRRAPGAFVRWRLTLVWLSSKLTSTLRRLEFCVAPNLSKICAHLQQCPRLPSSLHGERNDENVGSQTYDMQCCSTRSNHLTKLKLRNKYTAPSSNRYSDVRLGRAVYSVGLRPLTCWDCGFESRLGHGCLSWMLCVIKVEVSATDQSLVQTSPTGVCVRVCVSLSATWCYNSLYTYNI
jgi:hypothetical protein